MSKRARDPSISLSKEEEEEDLEEEGEVESWYVGERNFAGQYHGRGTLTLALEGVRYEGDFKNGEKHGNGTLFFPDGARMEGQFRNDSFEGEGSYINPDGSRLQGTWVDGELTGEGEELDENGVIVYEGDFKGGVRSGKGKLFFYEGARLRGTFVDNVPQGDCAYYYPNGSSLRGKWKDGEMVSAKYYDNEGKASGTAIYHLDESTKDHLNDMPLLSDPYEFELVYVKPSTIPNSGEGLFAKEDLPANFVCSFYNGIRISLKNANKKTWRANANNISLNNGTCVDIPPEYNDCQKVYCATLGHKANHHPKNNAMYDTYYNHPRFGKIKCIRTLVDVKKDDEIFVDYGYKKGTGPLWYRAYEKEKRRTDGNGDLH